MTTGYTVFGFYLTFYMVTTGQVNVAQD